MIYSKNITLFRLNAILVACLMLVGCREELPITAPEQYPIVLASEINTQDLQTKYAGGTEFEADDQISVYSVAWTTSNPPVLSTIAAENNFHNAKFKRDNTYFNFEATTDVASVGFPPNGSSIDIYAIYPYNATAITSISEYVVNTPADQTTKAKMITGDFLMAKKTKVAPQLQPINLDFNHMMAKLYVDVVVAQDYKDKAVSVTAVKFIAGTEAKINIVNQTTPVSTATTITNVSPLVTAKTNSADGCYAEAILPPQRFAAKVSCVEVTMSNAKTHIFAFESNFDLQFNTITQLTIKVAYGESNAVKIGETKITDWGTGVEINPSDPINQNSQNKFTVTATGNQTIAETVKYATVTTLVSGEKRTYELPALYDATGQKINFEFRGVGNRPNVYPFTVTQIKYYDASWQLITTSSVLSQNVTAADQPITLSQVF